MSTQVHRAIERLPHGDRRARDRPRSYPSAHAVAAWVLFAVYLFATACAVWDIVQPPPELRSHAAQAASAASAASR